MSGSDSLTWPHGFWISTDCSTVALFLSSRVIWQKPAEIEEACAPNSISLQGHVVQHGHILVCVPSQFFEQFVTERAISYNHKLCESCTISLKELGSSLLHQNQLRFLRNGCQRNFSPMRRKNKLKLLLGHVGLEYDYIAGNLFFFGGCVIPLASHKSLQREIPLETTNQVLGFIFIAVEQNSLPTYVWRREITPPKWLRWQITAYVWKNISKLWSPQFSKARSVACNKALRFHYQAPEIRGNVRAICFWKEYRFPVEAAFFQRVLWNDGLIMIGHEHTHCKIIELEAGLLLACVSEQMV